MTKRKYTRFGEKAVAYKCTNRKCKWEGLDSEKISIKSEDGWMELCCPECSKPEFFGLLELPNTQVVNEKN